MPVDSLDEAIEFVNARDHSLVLYAFSSDDTVKQRGMSIHTFCELMQVLMGFLSA